MTLFYPKIRHFRKTTCTLGSNLTTDFSSRSVYEDEISETGTTFEEDRTKREKQERDPTKPAFNHRRHWPKVFQRLEKTINPEACGTPVTEDEQRATVHLGGSCSISGVEIDMAFFYGDRLSSRSWCVFRVSEPCIVFESIAKQVNGHFKQTEVEQQLAILLGSRSVGPDLLEKTRTDDGETEKDQGFKTVYIENIIGEVRQRAESVYQSERQSEGVSPGMTKSGYMEVSND